jgi:solute carrier family 38 (sodium-coupled neutral amino acid transporter), member 11
LYFALRTYLILLEYELDSDDLDDTAISQLEAEQQQTPRSRRDREQAMPLLVGLLDSATARRSLDGTLQLENRGMFAEHEEEIDLEDLAAQRTAGGGLLDSIANMANSILGAGKSC